MRTLSKRGSIGRSKLCRSVSNVGFSSTLTSSKWWSTSSIRTQHAIVDWQGSSWSKYPYLWYPTCACEITTRASFVRRSIQRFRRSTKGEWSVGWFVVPLGMDILLPWRRDGTTRRRKETALGRCTRLSWDGSQGKLRAEQGRAWQGRHGTGRSVRAW